MSLSTILTALVVLFIAVALFGGIFLYVYWWLIQRALPELNGKLDGFAIRVPTINVSLVDLSFIAKRDTTVDEVNAALKAASEKVITIIDGTIKAFS
mgnify:CR=1 FL=1